MDRKKYKYLIEYKELMKEWDGTNNCTLDPNNLTYGSGKKVHWICSVCGERWQASIRDRVKGNGCPKCKLMKISIKKSIPRGKKLCDTHHQLMIEWNSLKNKNIKFDNISTYSNKKIWWICQKGHEWEEIVANRTKRNSGCPFCSNHRIMKGFNDLETLSPRLAKEWDYNKNVNIDINSIGLYSNKKVWWKCKNGHTWLTSPNNRMKGRNCPYCITNKPISIPEKTITFYLKQVFLVEEQKKFDWLGRMELDIYLPSLKIAVEYDGQAWHKNLDKDIEKEKKCKEHGIELIRIREPESLTYNGDCKCVMTDNVKKRFFVKCAIDELIKYINLKESSNYKIKYDYLNDYAKICEMVVSQREENNLEQVYPAISKQWNYEKNGNLIPSMFAPASNIEVWWKCSIGHEWFTSISERTTGKKGCPYCSNQKLLVGYNDLATKYPELISEWNYEKNGILTPNSITYGTRKKVWWKCSLGHEWEASVIDRTRNGWNCPICSNHKILVGYNDFESQYPNLAAEWDYKKNIIKPSEISYHYDKKVFWICEKGHEFESTVYNRVRKNTGCPVCANQKIETGYNDLESKNSTIALEWDYEKNNISPNKVAEQSNKIYWWKCNKGHSYEASPSNRFKGRGCPYCSNRKVLKGFNDLETIYPNIIEEWDCEKNVNLLPSEVTAHSSKKVYWKCKFGHSWQTTIRDRTSGGTNCPICYKENRKKKI